MDPIAACESLKQILCTLSTQLGGGGGGSSSSGNNINNYYDEIFGHLVTEIRELSAYRLSTNKSTPVRAGGVGGAVGKKYAASPPSAYEKNNRLLEKLRTPQTDRQKYTGVGVGGSKLTEIKSKKRTAAQSADIRTIEEEANARRRSARLEEKEAGHEENNEVGDGSLVATPPATKKKKGAKKKVVKKVTKKTVSIDETNVVVEEPPVQPMEDVVAATPLISPKLKKKKGRKKKTEQQEEQPPGSVIANRTINKSRVLAGGNKTPMMSRVSERRTSLLPVAASRLSCSVMKSVKKRPMTRRAAAAAAAAAAANATKTTQSVVVPPTPQPAPPPAVLVKVTKKNSMKKSTTSENLLNKTKTTATLVPSTPSRSNLIQASKIPVAATPQSAVKPSMLARLTGFKDSAKKALKIGPTIQSAIDKRKMKISTTRNPSEAKRKSVKLLAQEIINEIKEDKKSQQQEEEPRVLLPVVQLVDESKMDQDDEPFEEVVNQTLREDDNIEKQQDMEVNDDQVEEVIQQQHTTKTMTPRASRSSARSEARASGVSCASSSSSNRMAVTMNGASVQVSVRSTEEALMLQNLKSPTCKIARLTSLRQSSSSQIKIKTEPTPPPQTTMSNETCVIDHDDEDYDSPTKHSTTKNVAASVEDQEEDKKPFHAPLKLINNNISKPLSSQYKLAGSSFKSTSSIKTIGTPSRQYQTFQSLSSLASVNNNNYHQRTSIMKSVMPTPSKINKTTLEDEERRRREQLDLKESRDRERLQEQERQRIEKLNEKKRKDEEKKRQIQEKLLKKQKEEEERRVAELNKRRAEQEEAAAKTVRLKSSQFATFGSAQKKNNFLPSYLNNMTNTSSNTSSSNNTSKSNYENNKGVYQKPGGLLLNKINSNYSSLLVKPVDQTKKTPMDRNATYVLDEEMMTPDSPDNVKNEPFTNYLATPLQPPRLKDENNYDVSGLRSEDDTDDDEEPRKPVPEWAKKEALEYTTQMQFMNMINYSSLFRAAHNINVDLEEVFRKKSQKFTQRSSSAQWDSPIKLNNTLGEAEMSYMQIRTELDRTGFY